MQMQTGMKPMMNSGKLNSTKLTHSLMTSTSLPLRELTRPRGIWTMLMSGSWMLKRISIMRRKTMKIPFKHGKMPKRIMPTTTMIQLKSTTPMMTGRHQITSMIFSLLKFQKLISVPSISLTEQVITSLRNAKPWKDASSTESMPHADHLPRKKLLMPLPLLSQLCEYEN